MKQKVREGITYIDSKGTKRLDMDTLSKLRSVLLPIIVEQLHYVPIPVVEGENEDVAYRMEDMVISVYDLLPEHIFIDTETHTSIKPLSDYEHEYIDKTLEGGYVF